MTRAAESPQPPAPQLVVAAAVVDDLTRPRTLLAARRLRPAGRWEFPGGKVEPGETPEEALHRELDEELAIRVRLGAPILGDDHVGREGEDHHGGWRVSDQIVLRLWWAQLVGGPPTVRDEHDEVRLLGPGQWLSVPWLDADVRIVRALLSPESPGRQVVGHLAPSATTPLRPAPTTWVEPVLPSANTPRQS